MQLFVIVSPKRRTKTGTIRRTPKGPPSVRMLRQVPMLLFESQEPVSDSSPTDVIAPPTPTLLLKGVRSDNEVQLRMYSLI